MSVMINGITFLSQKCPDLDDRLYGHVYVV